MLLGSTGLSRSRGRRIAEPRLRLQIAEEVEALDNSAPCDPGDANQAAFQGGCHPQER